MFLIIFKVFLMGDLHNIGYKKFLLFTYTKYARTLKTKNIKEITYYEIGQDLS